MRTFRPLAFTAALLVAASVLGQTGTYQISYMYNAMSGGGPGGAGNPEGSQIYNRQVTAPLELTLGPGEYKATILPGIGTGNPGDESSNWFTGYYSQLVPANDPEAIYPDTGFLGGNAAPAYGLGWSYWADLWVGRSTAADDGMFLRVQGLGNFHTFSVNPDDKVWLYFYDWFIPDNFGGVTVGVEPVPEPASLSALSLCALVLLRRRKAA